MPKQYEAIRDRYVAKGMSYDKAQAIAAATYHARHPGQPMRRHQAAVVAAMRKGKKG